MAYTNQISDDAMLLVIALPKADSLYYKDVYAEIIAFDIAYAKAIIGNDNVVLIADEEGSELLRNQLPNDIILKEAMHDIWIRDFSTVLPYKPTLFRYTAAAQAGSQQEADWIQKTFKAFIDQFGIHYYPSSLKLDGGNVVDDLHNKLIVTDRFLEDNALNYTEGKDQLQKITGFKQIAIIPADSNEGLAHADGMLMFIDSNTLLVNKYPYPLRQSLFLELNLAFPHLKIIEVIAEIDVEDWDSHFPSACGLNVNAVVTKRCIYMPEFSTKNDAKFLALLKANTCKKIICVSAKKVCKLGGSVRCLTWQLTGKNANQLILAARAS
jgi:agmatine/peptidylarginine deiminase